MDKAFISQEFAEIHDFGAIEPAVIPDVFATGTIVERERGFIRLTYVVERRCSAGGRESIIVARIVMPTRGGI